MNRKTSLWLLALLPIAGLIWAMKSASSWRPQVFVTSPNVNYAWLSPNAQLMSAETEDNEGGFQIWDAVTRLPLWKSRGGTDFSLSMSPDERILILAHANHPLGGELTSLVGVEFETRDLRTGRLLRKLEKCDFKSADETLDYACSSKGDELILATRFYLRRWSLTTGKLLTAGKWMPLKDPYLGLTTAAPIPRNEQIIAYDRGSGIVIYDAHTGHQLRRYSYISAFPDPNGADNFLRVSPDEYSFYETSNIQSSGRVFRLSDGKLLWRYADWPTFSTDGKLAYVPSKSGLDVLDAHTGQHLNHLPGPRAYGFSISPDGNYLYEPRAGKIYRWRAR